MNLVIIDQLASENKYRRDFWFANKNAFKTVHIVIPEAINGVIVQRILDNGEFEEIDFTSVDLLIIHERDDRKTGYEGTARKLGKNIILYSDAFDDIPVYNEKNRILKIKGSVLYSRLKEFLSEIEISGLIDLVRLCQIDEHLEKLLQHFEKILPLKEYWESSLEKDDPYEIKRQLFAHLKLPL